MVITGVGDVIAWLAVTLLIIGAGCMVVGYAVVLRTAIRKGEGRRAVRALLSSSGRGYALDPRGMRLVYLGAGFGAVVFVPLAIGILVWMAMGMKGACGR